MNKKSLEFKWLGCHSILQIKFQEVQKKFKEENDSFENKTTKKRKNSDGQAKLLLSRRRAMEHESIRDTISSYQFIITRRIYLRDCVSLSV